MTVDVDSMSAADRAIIESQARAHRRFAALAAVLFTAAMVAIVYFPNRTHDEVVRSESRQLAAEQELLQRNQGQIIAAQECLIDILLIPPDDRGPLRPVIDLGELCDLAAETVHGNQR